MEEKEKGMDKKDFYKYLADLETLSEAQSELSPHALNINKKNC